MKTITIEGYAQEEIIYSDNNVVFTNNITALLDRVLA